MVITMTAISAPVNAVAAWARRYGVDCSMCHWRLNRLNQTGRMFLLRGHRMPGDKGWSEDKKDLGDYVTLTSKIRYIVDRDRSATENIATEFDIEAFSLYTGGPIEKNWSYFVEQYFSERSGTTTRSKLADAYAFYNSDPDDDTWFYARAGQIYPYQIYYYGSGGRLSIGRPSVINDVAGLGNNYTPRDRAYGVSVGRVTQSGFLGELGIINGAGGNKTPNIRENNNHKDAYLTLEKVLDSNGSSLGAYAYKGEFKVSDTFTDKFDRFGLVGNYTNATTSIMGGALWGSHDLVAGGERDAFGYYLEVGKAFDPNWVGFVRYDYYDRDKDDASLKIRGPVIGASYRLGKVGRITTEYKGYKSGSAKDRTLMTEFQWMY